MPRKSLRLIKKSMLMQTSFVSLQTRPRWVRVGNSHMYIFNHSDRSVCHINVFVKKTPFLITANLIDQFFKTISELEQIFCQHLGHWGRTEWSPGVHCNLLWVALCESNWLRSLFFSLSFLIISIHQTITGHHIRGGRYGPSDHCALIIYLSRLLQG